MNPRKEIDNITSSSDLAQSETSSTNAIHPKIGTWPYETVQALNGNYVTRIKSSVFHWGALVAFISGVVFLSYGLRMGGFLVLTLAPFLLLYPIVRFLVGGKDSAIAVVTTVVVQEVLKHQIRKATDKASKK